MLSTVELILEKFINQTKECFWNQGIAIQSLDTQVGQLSRLLDERSQVFLLYDTMMNPREQYITITLRGGKSYEGLRLEDKPVEASQVPPKTQSMIDALEQALKDTFLKKNSQGERRRKN